jgi:hypothetical protein
MTVHLVIGEVFLFRFLLVPMKMFLIFTGQFHATFLGNN